MKKVFNRNGKFYGMAKQITKDNNNLIITMPGDFPGMIENRLNNARLYRWVIYVSNKSIYKQPATSYALYSRICTCIAQISNFYALYY